MGRVSKYDKIKVGEVVNGFVLVSGPFRCGNGARSGEFLCPCGEIFSKMFGNIIRSQTVGCSGCVKKHAKGVTRVHPKEYDHLYKTWKGINHRCTNPKNPQYRNYGGRGIKICDGWSDKDSAGFVNFCEDMGPKPVESHTVDRINNEEGYYKENCRWASQQEQTSNTRRNNYVEFEGESYTVTNIANILGIKPNTLTYRLRRGWPLEEALELVPRRR